MPNRFWRSCAAASGVLAVLAMAAAPAGRAAEALASEDCDAFAGSLQPIWRLDRIEPASMAFEPAPGRPGETALAVTLAQGQRPEPGGDGQMTERAELQEALVFLSSRMRDLALDGPPGFGSVHGIYGLDSLPICFQAA